MDLVILLVNINQPVKKNVESLYFVYVLYYYTSAINIVILLKNYTMLHTYTDANNYYYSHTTFKLYNILLFII